MDDIKIELKMIPPIGAPQTIMLDSCLIGGFMGDGSNLPMGAYMGSLNFDKTMASMEHIVRAFIKVFEEQVIVSDLAPVALIPKEKQMDLIKGMMTSIIDRAFEVEKRNAAEDNVDLETHMVKMRYDKERE